MISILARIFIKNYSKFEDAEVRLKYGVLCSVVGFCFNLLLALMKIVLGIISGAISIVADGVNNVSDAAGAVISFVGFKISGKKPDAEHPFGHGRMEYIAALMLSFLVLTVGFEIFKNSVEELFNPGSSDFSWLSVGLLFVSVAVKFYMFLYNRLIGKKIQSVAMKAAASDSISDVVSTLGVIAAAVLAICFPDAKVSFDGIAGLFVSFFILWNGFESVFETVNPLLGAPAKTEFIQEIEKVAVEHKNIIGIHDVVVHDYGPGRKMISFHAEVPGDKNIFELHKTVDHVEAEISRKFNCRALIHMDPVDVNDPKLKEIEEIVKKVAGEIDPKITVHDVRIIHGSKYSRLIFDAVRPEKCLLNEEKLRHELSRKISALCPEYHCIINIDLGW